MFLASTRVGIKARVRCVVDRCSVCLVCVCVCIVLFVCVLCVCWSVCVCVCCVCECLGVNVFACVFCVAECVLCVFWEGVLCACVLWMPHIYTAPYPNPLRHPSIILICTLGLPPSWQHRVDACDSCRRDRSGYGPGHVPRCRCGKRISATHVVVELRIRCLAKRQVQIRLQQFLRLRIHSLRCWVKGRH